MMLDQFDYFASGVSPELREASGIYTRAKLGELIDRTVELAGVRAGQFNGSGMENALRTEFRQLQRQITKGQLKGISPQLAEAIRNVAEGGPIQNVLRAAGRFAPTGVVSTGVGGGLGYAMGGPVGSAAVLGAGALGRQGAEMAARRGADVAGAVARSGGALPDVPFSPLVDALIATGAAEMGDISIKAFPEGLYVVYQNGDPAGDVGTPEDAENLVRVLIE